MKNHLKTQKIRQKIGFYRNLKLANPDYWSKTNIWIPRFTFYDAWKLSYTLKLPWTMTLALLVLVYIWQF